MICVVSGLWGLMIFFVNLSCLLFLMNGVCELVFKILINCCGILGFCWFGWFWRNIKGWIGWVWFFIIMVFGNVFGFEVVNWLIWCLSFRWWVLFFLLRNDLSCFFVIYIGDCLFKRMRVICWCVIGSEWSVWLLVFVFFYVCIVFWKVLL